MERARGREDLRLLNIGTGPTELGVLLRVVPYSATKPPEIYPPVSVLDQCVVQAHSWGAAAAWKEELKLDPTTHPGGHDTSQLIEIVPMESEWLVLKFLGSEDALLTHHDVIQKVLASVRFSFAEK
jgi:hypothetical protein